VGCSTVLVLCRHEIGTKAEREGKKGKNIYRLSMVVMKIKKNSIEKSSTSRKSGCVLDFYSLEGR
jgi:hypothetical protein